MRGENVALQFKERLLIGRSWPVIWLLLLLSLCGLVHAQVDQGAITGVVQDSSGAAIPNARVTLTSPETGLALQRQANESGVYVFSPIKIGDYTLSASAPGFSTTKQENLHVDIQQRLNVDLKLKAGAASETSTTLRVKRSAKKLNAIDSTPSKNIPLPVTALIAPIRPE